MLSLFDRELEEVHGYDDFVKDEENPVSSWPSEIGHVLDSFDDSADISRECLYVFRGEGLVVSFWCGYVHGILVNSLDLYLFLEVPIEFGYGCVICNFTSIIDPQPLIVLFSLNNYDP